MPKPNLICVGFSVRALAQAAADAGYRPITVDAFGDFDTLIVSCQHHTLQNWGVTARTTSKLSESSSLSNSSGKLARFDHTYCDEQSNKSATWQDDICSVVASSPANSIVLFAGGAENWPHMWSRLQALRPIAGPTTAQMLLLRSPQQLRQWCADSAGIPPIASSRLSFPLSSFCISPNSPETPVTRVTRESCHSLDHEADSHWFRPHHDSGRAGSEHSRFGTEPNDLSAGNERRLWLIKSTRSCGGTQVRWLDQTQSMNIDEAERYFQSLSPRSLKVDTSNEPIHSSEQYIQAFIPGRVLGITGLLTERDCRILGIVESIQDPAIWLAPNLVGDQFTRPHSNNLGSTSHFSYHGSWGPVSFVSVKDNNPESSPSYAAALRFLETLRMQTSVRGYLQFDVVEEVSGQLWLLEINPRWTSGMEVLFRSGLCNPLTSHLEQHHGTESNEPDQSNSPLSPCENAKVIYYMRRDMHLTIKQVRSLQAASNPTVIDFPDLGCVESQVADIPSLNQNGVEMRANQPLVTILTKITSHTAESIGNRDNRALRLLQAATRQAAQKIDHILENGDA